MPTLILIPLLLLAAACGGAPSLTGPQPGTPQLAASKLAILAVGAATAPQGRSFFDNFLPCPRRGVIDYRNTPLGRQVTFSGCDAGDGVVVDGSAELRWTQAGGDRERIERIEVVGPLTVRVGEAASTLQSITITGIAFRQPSSESNELVVERLITSDVRVVSAGTVAMLDERATPAAVFRPAITADAIPNPGGSLDALTDADLKRIAYHGAMALAGILFNETLEIQRGAHEHVEPCGTMQVTPIVATNLPLLQMSWNACDMRLGIFESGNFSAQWLEMSQQSGRLSMRVQGALTLGGGVPTVTLDRLDWTVSNLAAGFPATIRIAGTLVRGAQQRSYVFDLVVDD